MSIRRAILLLPLIAPVAVGQTAGEILWTVDLEGSPVMSQPAVGPDGTVYLVTDRLYAISPDGAIRWTAPAYQEYVDVGPDGTIYTGAVNTIYAYNPDGSLRWSFTEPPGGQGLMQGPTLGPDGNIYAVTDLGGLGALSLTPQGDLRWNIPGFSWTRGTGLGRIQFGPDNFYFAEEWVPGCSPSVEGMASISFDGSLEWCISISGVARPTASVDGKAFTWQEGFSGKRLTAYEPDGGTAWSHLFDWSPTGIASVAAGPDNHLYVFHNLATLARMTADGAMVWQVSYPLETTGFTRATVAPDLSSVVFGASFGYGVNGKIVAADPANGGTLWTVPVTGPSMGVDAPVAFSSDGSVVYVPVGAVDNSVPDQVWAIRVREEATTGNAPSPGRDGHRLSSPHPNPFGQQTSLTLAVAEPQQVTVVVHDALGRRVASLHDGRVPAGSHIFTLDAAGLPAGVYVVRITGEGFVDTRRVILAR